MDTDRNLLFGVLALQADLIDTAQFVEACTLWTTRKHTPLAELLIERGWLVPADKAHLDYLLERKLARNDGDARASLAGAADDIKRSLAALGDPDIQQSLAGLPAPLDREVQATVDYAPVRGERYHLMRLHATGGIGRIWLARDSELGRDVALKELRPERAGSAQLWNRFLQEARITGQLEHPGIVPVYELGARPDNQPFYTMRFVKGRTLSEAARAYHQKRAAGHAESLDLLSLLNAFVTVCNTVAYAHSHGVIHRDLKGQNVVLGDFGEVVVLDWGLAKLVNRPEGESRALLGRAEPAAEASDYTVEGQTLGTPAYMAPEQAAGRPDLIDRRTDVYGLGAILYEILTGRPPFMGSDTAEVLRQVQEEEPLPPSRLVAEIPPALEAVCLRALAKQPVDRPGTATELALAVQGWQEFERRKAEEALRASEALYHSLVETIPLGVWRKDLDGRFTFGNKRFCESLGQPVDQVIGKTDFDFFPAELAEKYRRDDRSVHRTGTSWSTAEDHIGANGEKLFVEVVKSPIFGASEQVIGTQGIFWDVTERKRFEEELAYERFLLHSLMNSTPDGIYFKDRDSRFIRVNKTVAESFGLSDPTQVLGKTDFDFFAEEFARQAYADEQEIIRTGRAIVAKEEECIFPDGRVRWASATKMPLYDRHGHIIGTIGITREITKGKHVEETM
jgi:PAS domain S-box-containing protein